MVTEGELTEYMEKVENVLKTEHGFRVEKGHTDKTFGRYFEGEHEEVSGLLYRNRLNKPHHLPLLKEGFLDEHFGDGFTSEMLDDEDFYRGW